MTSNVSETSRLAGTRARAPEVKTINREYVNGDQKQGYFDSRADRLGAQSPTGVEWEREGGSVTDGQMKLLHNGSSLP